MTDNGGILLPRIRAGDAPALIPFVINRKC